MSTCPCVEGKQFLPLVFYTYLFLFGFSSAVSAQPKSYPTIDFGGIFQPRISYGSMEGTTSSTNRLGYGIRRARIRTEVMVREKLGVRYVGDLASGTLQSVDLFAFYQFSEKVSIRMGIMASAQPRAHNFTSTALIDGFDRAVVAEQWSGATLGSSGRDFGLDIQYQTPEWSVVAFLHNGDGSFNRSRGNFSQTISSESTTRGIDRSVLATSIYVAHRIPSLKGVEVGGFLSQNASKNPNTAGDSGEGRAYMSYAAHAYYGAVPGSQPFRLKFDLIGLNFQGVDEQKRLSASILGAVGLNEYTELFARYENVQRDTPVDGTDFLSGGLTFSLSKLHGGSYEQQRATLGYSMLESPLGNKQHLIVLQWQFVL